MKTTLIYGGPGTGKTHALLQCVTKEYEENGTQPENMAYVSFTRRGTYQGVDLVKETLDFTDEQCRYFKTLHSLCFHALDLSKSSLMTIRDMEKMRTQLEYSINDFDTLLEQDSIARNKMKEADALSLYKAKLQAGKAKADIEVCKRVKDQLSKVDFTDVLELVVEKGITLPVDVAFIDEAQDLTILQWRVVATLFKNAKHIYLAGDVNQSLFKWAGADYDKFMNIPSADIVFLNKSYRCSKSVWQYARFVYSGIKDRVPMPEECRDEEGFAISAAQNPPLHWIPQLAKQGTVYCLSYTTAGLKTYADYLTAKGVPFVYKDKKSKDVKTTKADILGNFLRFYVEVMTNQDLYNKYVNWTALGITVPKAQKRRIRYQRDQLRELMNNQILPFGSIRKDLMLAYAKKHSRMKPEWLENYIANEAYAYKEIIVSVIHRIKGGEADFVFIRDNVPHRQRKNVIHDDALRDELSRVLYVAITRAKKGVVLWRTASGKTLANTEDYPPLGNIYNYIKESDDDKNN